MGVSDHLTDRQSGFNLFWEVDTRNRKLPNQFAQYKMWAGMTIWLLQTSLHINTEALYKAFVLIWKYLESLTKFKWTAVKSIFPWTSQFKKMISNKVFLKICPYYPIHTQCDLWRHIQYTILSRILPKFYVFLMPQPYLRFTSTITFNFSYSWPN